MDAAKDFCSNFFYGIYLIFYYIYRGIHFVISTILKALGVIWYPVKERVRSCCDCFRKKMNPYENPNYNAFGN